ncbi:hypothetical protein PAHAL_3G439400 [Panicum hallii]|uniref:Uncharacterized protein n=1 Tax=Panicum hallii TaxID=206008 RepID=A0A2T8KLA0_9POAL|nr:hypothetical protein PAHAL_3G439400 [Panicum hallii]
MNNQPEMLLEGRIIPNPSARHIFVMGPKIDAANKTFRCPSLPYCHDTSVISGMWPCQRWRNVEPEQVGAN